ncbi:hypothetical protein RhiJN_13721 [Ceratobasidium sp. AG-Ba]|nr:hypothetical protein RhiJN_13721 [Ceratobasidium sp. AG-Ba]
MPSSQFVTDSLKQRLDFAAMKDVHSAVEAVKHLPDDANAVETFTEGSSQDGETNFQVNHCHTIGHDVVVALGSFTYHTAQSIKNPLSAKLKGASANARFGYTTMTLNARVYNLVRQAVRTKLGSNTDKIVDISL